MNEVALDQRMPKSDSCSSRQRESSGPNADAQRRPSTTGVRHYKLALTRGRQRLPDDEVRELGDWLSRFHWQAFVTPTFRFPVKETQARSAVEGWLRKLGSHVYAYVAYEEGKAGGRTHVHALIGGLVPRGRDTATGIHHLKLSLTRLRRAWRHGHEDVDGNVKVEQYDPRRGAAWYVAKFPYDGELLGGQPTRHRQRRRR